MIRVSLLALACLGTLAIGAEDPADPAAAGEAKKAVHTMLDDFHTAKAEPDADRYFGYIDPDAVFFGTAPEERWSKPELEELMRGPMSQGYGPPSKVAKRHVYLAASGDVAWFDEWLDRPKFGELRATGVVQREGGAWRIVQYHLTYPVPNEAIRDVIKLSRPHLKGK